MKQEVKAQLGVEAIEHVTPFRFYSWYFIVLEEGTKMLSNFRSAPTKEAQVQNADFEANHVTNQI